MLILVFGMKLIKNMFHIFLRILGCFADLARYTTHINTLLKNLKSKLGIQNMTFIFVIFCNIVFGVKQLIFKVYRNKFINIYFFNSII